MIDNFQISLKAARVNAGYTQEEAAKGLGVGVGTYIKWEADPSRISALKQRDISLLFGIPIDYINFLPN